MTKITAFNTCLLAIGVAWVAACATCPVTAYAKAPYQKARPVIEHKKSPPAGVKKAKPVKPKQTKPEAKAYSGYVNLVAPDGIKLVPLLSYKVALAAMSPDVQKVLMQRLPTQGGR